MRRSNSRVRLPLAASACIALLLSACGTSNVQEPSPSAPATPSPTATGNGSPSPSDPDQPPFYEGKTIEIIAPVEPGGAVDGTARLLGEFLGRYLPGSPTVQVNNISTGAGIGAGNTFMNSRDPDGETLMFFTHVTILPSLLGDAAANYSIAQMRPLWAANRGQSVIPVRPETGVTSPEDLSNPDEPLILGVINPAGADLPTIIGLEALGVFNNPVRVIAGYSGEGMDIAYSAGEISMNRVGSVQYLANFIDDPDYVGIYTHGYIGPDGELVSDPVVPDLPHLGEAYEMIHGQAPSGIAYEAFKMLVNLFANGGFSLVTHDGVPAEALEALDGALAEILADPEFDERIKAVLGPEPGQTIGQDAVAWGQRAADLDPALVTWLQEFLSEHFEMEFN